MNLNKGVSVERLMFKYNVSKSTIYKIKNTMQNKKFKESSITNIYEDVFGLNIDAMNETFKAIIPPKPPLTIQGIRLKLKSDTNLNVSTNNISKYLRNWWRYSFKKGSSTSIAGSSSMILEMQTIFSWRIVKEILNKKYIVNIDESSFNKDLKMEYSWLPKGVTSSIINQFYCGSTSMLTAFWSDGEYIWVILNDTVNSTRFSDFLWIVRYFLDLMDLNTPDKTIILLDNAAYHRSYETKEKLKELNLNTIFLPPYSPVFAQVEQYFKQIKSKIRSLKVSKPINYQSKTGCLQICKAWDMLKINSLRQLWKVFVKIVMYKIFEYREE